MVRRPQGGLDAASLPLHRLSLSQRRLWLYLAILLLGLGLRAPLIWSSAPLDIDEALYASTARQISHENDGWLAGSAVDKPPLSFYLTALSFKLFGDPSDWAARLPNLVASVLSLAVLARLARRLYRADRPALLGMLALALSPFDIAFAGTAFLDPQTTLWTLLACLMVTEDRWAWAGLSLGLAFATKPSALFALPLILALGVIAWHTSDWKTLARRLALLGMAAALIAALALGWGLLRQGAPDWWALNAAHNSPGRLIRADEVGPRLAAWLEALAQAFGGIVPALGLSGTAAIGLAWRVRRQPMRRSAVFDLVLAGYLLACLAAYWLVAFNLYERYLHLLIPPACLLIGRGLDLVVRLVLRKRSAIVQGLAAGALLIGLGPAVLEAQSGHPILSHNQARYAGIIEAARYLNQLPPGTIVYDHWLGWSLGWYTGQDRPPDMWLRITYYPTPEALAADSRQQPDAAPRYFVAPDWVWAGPWLDALNANGPPVEQVARFGRIVIYRFDPG